jgi:hypothetical protein
MVQNSPYSRIVFINHISQRLNRHVLGHQHNQGIHQQSEPAALPCPGYFDLFNTAFLAFRARDTTVQVGFKLKEIQVTPSSLDCIMNMTSGLTA